MKLSSFIGVSDAQLLKYYQLGWHDENFGATSTVSTNEEENVAYLVGVNHYMIGDDVTSIDSWTTEQILEDIKRHIKEGYKKKKKK